MRALPEILRRRPNAQIVIIGRDGLSYGLLRQWARPKSFFLRGAGSPTCQVSTGGSHIRHSLQLFRYHRARHLTYPFVLSWSMLEAMSAGCLVIGSDTSPVREVIRSGENGMLVPFFGVEELAGRVIEALQEPTKFSAIREAARRFVVDHYDTAQICLPRMRRFLDLKTRATSSPRALWPGRPAAERLKKGTRRASRESPAPVGMAMSGEGEAGRS